jgi:sugar phosphate permease
VVVTAVAFAVMAVVHSPAVSGVVLFVAGFFLLAGLPVVLDWSELHAGPERAGGAAGFLLLAGNLGGVILALIVQAVIGNPYLSLGALAVAGLAGLALATRLPARGTGAAQHAGSGPGAGPAQDAGTARDAGPAQDAGTAQDAGAAQDAGTAREGGQA